MPKTTDLEWQWLLSVLRLNQFFREFENALDVIVVDVTDHHHVNRQRGIRIKPACLSDLRETRLEMGFINVRWSTVDQCQTRLVFGAEVKNEAVAFARTSYVQCKKH